MNEDYFTNKLLLVVLLPLVSWIAGFMWGVDMQSHRHVIELEELKRRCPEVTAPTK